MVTEATGIGLSALGLGLRVGEFRFGHLRFSVSGVRIFALLGLRTTSESRFRVCVLEGFQGLLFFLSDSRCGGPSRPRLGLMLESLKLMVRAYMITN